MSDLQTLAAIEALPDHDADPETPADGQQPQARTADAVEADDDESLSPEDLVAEAVRQDREQRGEEVEAEGDEESDEESEPDDLDALREKARQFDAWREQQAHEQLNSVDRQLDADYETRLGAIQTHYAAEWQRLRLQVYRDAQTAVDPERYYAENIDKAWRSVDQGFQSYAGGLKAEYDARKQGIFQERTKPLFAKELITRAGLPDDPRVMAELLKVSDPRRMPERADELRRIHLMFLEQARVNSQQTRDAQAVQIKVEQPHPNASAARPARKKPVSYKGTTGELAAIERLR